MSASGGDQEFIDGGFKYHVFEQDGTLTVSDAVTADILAVAGGGGGGFEDDPDFAAGGGGAGGAVLSTGVSLSAASYSVTVGAGGAGAADDTASGAQGAGSDFDGTTVTATGGGGGSTHPFDGGDGGSGGGAVDETARGEGTAGEGNDGGVATGHCSGGGGGGRTASGGDGFASSGGDGGDGNTYFGLFTVAGGGGGGASGPSTCGGDSDPGTGGTGGGGDGAADGSPAGDGAVNTGGGGGGGSGFSGVNAGGDGGSGVVVVRYETDNVDASLAGALPSLSGSFTVDVAIDASLAGTLPALSGSFTAAVGDVDASLAGSLPALSGDMTVQASPDVDASLAGTLPALSGAFTLAQPEPEPVTPAIWAPTSDQILDLDGVYRREDGFRFDLLDQAEDVIGELHPDRNRPPQIRMDTGRAVQRTMSNFHLPFDEATDINTIANRVRPVMVLQNGDEFPLGVFLWADESRPERAWGTEHAASLADKALMLNQPAVGSMSWGEGADPVLILHFMALQSLDLGEIASVDEQGGLTEPVSWNPGTRWLRAMSDICEMVGFTAPWFDRDGVLHLEEPPDPATQTPVTSYGPGNRVVQDTIVHSDDLLEAPNVFSVHETGGESTIVGRYELPPSAPHSVNNRGFQIALAESVQGLPSQRSADRSAENLATSAGVAFDWVEFEATADPRHDVWNVVEYERVNWVETGWELTCRSGVPMSHTLRRVHN